ncbi:hypothetical protein BC939DRAFT_478681 [Gamsiella multidivaricata]|uniref:uncharacterized protein n=1 Tax=Gamsiella multidivaricata TaxID=101098 RepID=UPI00221FBD69|nr:uncharacterized protein BC939DRAFT_478681 [Gamsiella multidivaricata]KAG0371326.1 hypothetical protein BGZ54_006615 [Gamsiella multidivaricata]KAI7820805.1 hypothetical protein BC939DRAFT_478681 [Gamsiella multidivaricata]
MSLLRHTARRSFNVALTYNTPAVARLPLFARTISSQAPLFNQKEVIKHAPGWKQENASASEATVKADREPHPKNMKDLQDETVEHLTSDSTHAVHDLKNEAESMGKKAAAAGERMTENLSGNSKEYADMAKNAGERISKNLSGNSKEYADKAKAVGERVTENLSGSTKEYADKAVAMGENMSKNSQEYVDKAKAAGEHAAKQTMEYAGEAKKEAQQTGESMLGGVKSGAEKVTQFVKESVDSAKKAVGMDK